MSKRNPPKKKEISNEWLTTYSDMMTLVLTFFVLLYSFSMVDEGKFNAAASSLAEAFKGSKVSIFDGSGSEQLPESEIVPSNNDEENIDDEAGAGGTTYQTVEEFVKENGLDDYVTIRNGSRGVYIEFKDKILFDPGKADIKQQGIPVLDAVSKLIGKLPNKLVIEGHTDNVPMHNAQFSSNWELSYGRAFSVLKYLADKKGISESRLSVAAYGEYSPIASNDTAEGKAQNRRVNILILTADEGDQNKQ